MDIKKTESMGMRMVTILVENQLHGEMSLNRDKGTEFRIKFKEVK
jgi:two-component sensor histidine kinase